MMNSKQVFRQRAVKFRQWSNKNYGAFNSLKKVVKICTLAMAYSMVAQPLQVKAQRVDTTSSGTFELDEVTVQSTLIELKNAETGRSIEVIHGSQIQALPVTTVDELLRYVPGIDAQQRGAFGAQTDFSLRGSNFAQVLVLIDGQKINDPLTAHFNSNIPISLSEIERIEIIRGPASAEYGPDATAGVINIISKTFSKNSFKGFKADAKLNYGQYNLINSSDGFFWGTDKFRVSGGVMMNKSDGNPLESGLKGYFDIRDITVAGQYQMTPKWSASYRYANDYRDFNAQYFYTDYPSDKAVETVKRDRHQFQIIRNTEKYFTKILTSYIQTSDMYLYAPGSVPNNNASGNLDILAQQSVNVSNSFIALLGTSFDRRSVTSNSRGNHALSHYSIFTTISVKPVAQMTFNAGMREDFDENYGNYFLPQVGVSYKVSAPISIRASVGRSVRAADFTENYISTATSDTVSKTVSAVGNPDLLPERAWNSELGVDCKIGTMLLSITGFDRQVTNLIDYVQTLGSNIHINNLKLYPKNLYWFAENNSKAGIKGLETRISANPKILSNLNSRFILGYTFINMETNYTSLPKYTMLHPKHLINGETTMQYKIISWSFNGLYKVRDSFYDKNLNQSLKSSYMVWNTNMDVAVYKNIGYLSFSIFNVFNEKYADFFGAEMPGRWIAGGIKFKLDN
jgi:vitamin B12 transporter